MATTPAPGAVSTSSLSRNEKFMEPGQREIEALLRQCYNLDCCCGGAVAQLGARLDGIEEVVGSNPISSTKPPFAGN
jgi:hypothetical protein